MQPNETQMVTKAECEDILTAPSISVYYRRVLEQHIQAMTLLEEPCDDDDNTFCHGIDGLLTAKEMTSDKFLCKPCQRKAALLKLWKGEVT